VLVDPILDMTAARVEEQLRGQGAHDDRDADRKGDAGEGQHQGDTIELHGDILAPVPAVALGPKVTRTMGRRRLLAGFGALAASACAPAAARPPASAAPPYIPPLGAYPSKGVWPAQYHRAAAPVREAYAFAVANEASLRFIPCFCGCGADGHTSNYSCYVRSRLPDGGVILDTHGFG